MTVLHSVKRKHCLFRQARINGWKGRQERQQIHPRNSHSAASCQLIILDHKLDSAVWGDEVGHRSRVP